jgi:hypothetical protein
MEDASSLGMDEAFYVDDAERRDRYSRSEAAIGFAERFTADAASFDDGFWPELRAAFSFAEQMRGMLGPALRGKRLISLAAYAPPATCPARWRAKPSPRSSRSSIWKSRGKIFLFKRPVDASGLSRSSSAFYGADVDFVLSVRSRKAVICRTASKSSSGATAILVPG